MVHAKQGDTVKVHYTGKLEDGTVFDSSVDREPLEFAIGTGSLIPGFEQANLKPSELLQTKHTVSIVKTWFWSLTVSRCQKICR